MVRIIHLTYRNFKKIESKMALCKLKYYAMCLLYCYIGLCFKPPRKDIFRQKNISYLIKFGRNPQKQKKSFSLIKF